MLPQPDHAVIGPHQLENCPDLVLVIDAASLCILDVNNHPLAELGLAATDLVGRSLLDIGVSDHNDVRDLLANAGPDRTVYFDRHLRLSNGGQRSYNFAGRAADETCASFLLVGRKIDALTHSQSQLAALLKLADLTDDIFVVSDMQGRVMYANAAAARTHGVQEFVGREGTDFLHEDDEGYEVLINAVLNREPRTETRLLAKRPDGSPLMLEVHMVFDSESNHCFLVERDITEAVSQERRMEALTADLRRRATTDSLTGVANRAALNDVLAQAIADTEPFALLLLDMDNFKSVNDQLGHAAGDEFLQCVARRIQGALGPTDMAARLGGDEFVVYLPGISSDTAADVADRMINAVGQSFSVAGIEIARSCSIGVAVREPGDDASAVLRKADRAAYRAKHEGRSRFVVY